MFNLKPTMVPLLAIASELLIPLENIYFGRKYNYSIIGSSLDWDTSKD